MHDYSTENVKNWIVGPLRTLGYVDKVLLNRRVKEECINHRLARFLELCYTEVFHDEFPAYLEIDLEYNKNVSQGPKMLELEDGSFISIRPDVIVHDRSTNSSNILAVEAKLGSLRIGDRLKLSGLVREPYNYLFSLGVSYLPEKNYFRVVLYSAIDEPTTFDVLKNTND